MSNSEDDKAILINSSDEVVEVFNERYRPSRIQVVCNRMCVICFYILCPFIFVLRVLGLSVDCCHSCVTDCCGTCCCECLRGCGRALTGSCARGVRSLGRCGRECCSIGGEMSESLKRMGADWHNV